MESNVDYKTARADTSDTNEAAARLLAPLAIGQIHRTQP